VAQALGVHPWNLDAVPIDWIQKAMIIVQAERQAVASKVGDNSIMPVTNVPLVH
jgi:hypothetical protein